MKDYYYILGIDINSTSIEIREAYKKLSKKFHPDLNGNDHYFADRFKEINEAYETLNDPRRRGKYDAALKRTKQNVPLEENNYQRKPSRSANKAVNITFTLMLIFITTLFGYYVVKTVSGSKAKKVIPDVSDVATVPVVKHHKRKHGFKVKTDSDLAEAPIAEVKPTRRLVDTDKAKPVKPTPVFDNKVVSKSSAVVINNNDKAAGYLYATNIKANLTGVVYMRKQDSYGADVVETIPANSKVWVTETGKTFCKISFNDKTGYVPKWTVGEK